MEKFTKGIYEDNITQNRNININNTRGKYNSYLNENFSFIQIMA